MVPQAPFAATILIVEDDEATRLLYIDMFSMFGYRTVVAATGQAALDLLTDTFVDAIVLDRRLPDMDGIAVCEQVRARISARVPVLMVTADTDPMLEAAAASAGVTKLAYKPFRPEQLLLLLAKLLAQ